MIVGFSDLIRPIEQLKLRNNPIVIPARSCIIVSVPTTTAPGYISGLLFTVSSSAYSSTT